MRKVLILFSFIAVFASPSFAGNVETLGIGSKATAMGGAFTAYADDPFAVYYNPAGLTQIKKPTLSIGGSIVDMHLKLHDFTVGNNDPEVNGGQTFKDNSRYLMVPHIGFAMPINDKLAFGVAIYVPYGADIRWKEKDVGAYNNYHAYYIRETITPTLAYKFNDKLSIGAGVSFGMTRMGAERKFYVPNRGYNDPLLGLQGEGMHNSLLAPMLHGKKVNADGPLEDEFNWSWNAGIMYKPTDKITLGIVYRSETDVGVNGEVQLEDVLDLSSLNMPMLQNGTDLLGMGPTSVQGTTNFDHPAQLQTGIRYQPNSKLSLEVDVVWTNWSINKHHDITFNPNLMILSGEPYPRNWDDTVSYKFGVEYMLADNMFVRGGYVYDPSPIPDETFDLMWTDNDRHIFSLGTGLTLGKLTIDTFVQYLHFEERNINGESVNLNHSFEDLLKTQPAPEVSLKADGGVWAVGATMTYAF